MCEKLKDILLEKMPNLEEGQDFFISPSKKKIIRIARNICLENNKGKIIYSYLLKLMNYEEKITKKGRDHVVHSVHTYLLGRIIVDKINDLKPNEFDVFTWKISSLFHDIGYGCYEDFPGDSGHLGFDLKRQHGFWGAIMTWNAIYSEYLKENQNKKSNFQKKKKDGYVSYDWGNLKKYIYPACEAIYFHDNEGSRLLSYSDNKYAFLLVLCDSIQCWCRPVNSKERLKCNELDLYFIKRPVLMDDLCVFSICFPESIDAEKIRKEIKDKCRCDIEMDHKRMNISWRI